MKDGMIVVESKKTGEVRGFTCEQWENMKATGHDIYFRIIDASGLLPEPVEPVAFAEEENKEPKTHITIDYELDYGKLMDEMGIKYNHAIKKPEKLKALYEAAVNK